MTRELHLELLLGKRVYDTAGHPIGRLEEVRVEQQGDDWVITEYLIGFAAVFERLSAWNLGLGMLHLLGAHKLYEGYCVSWEQLDLSDPQHLRLCCSLDQLKGVNSDSRSKR
jgi:hypothetical protein